LFVGPSVVDPRSPDLERTGTGDDVRSRALPFAGHKRMTLTVAFRLGGGD